jgi:hypothetical protein
MQLVFAAKVQYKVPSGSQVRELGTFLSRAEAETSLADHKKWVGDGPVVVDRYWVEEIDATGLFQVPSLPVPRERFTAEVTITSPPKTGRQIHVEVLDLGRKVGEYDRNYAMLDTFEPFRQGDRNFALISPNYTATSVMDLASGEIIAGEEPSSMGFCPVGFYVPDWWDVQGDRRVLPGSRYWTSDDEWPIGDFGFVWGCIWGDDSSWKVQYLDLSAVADGVLKRSERFGYVRLATNKKLTPKDFIRLDFSEGTGRVTFAIDETFYLATGTRIDAEDL